jgi:hypothetical protein
VLSSRPAGSSGRETRLLVVTLVLSAVFLFVLARFRFPETQRPASAALAAVPLDQLAARATYDDLARVMTSLERRVQPSIVVLEIQETTSEAVVPSSRLVPALRVRDDLALVALQPGDRVKGARGERSPGRVVVEDEIRGVAAVTIRPAPAPTLSLVPDPTGEALTRYIAVVEASGSGPSIHPVFVGRLDPVDDPRWDRPIATLGRSAVALPGSWLFTLRGELIGLVTSTRHTLTLVPASLVMEAATDLAEGRTRKRGDLGIIFQPLTPALAKATAADFGVVVASVRPDGPAASLEAGDVVQAISGRPVRSLPDALLLSSAVALGSAVPVTVHRGSETIQVDITAGERPPGPDRATGELGVTVRAGAEGLDVLRVAPGSAAAAAGLVVGNRISHVDRTPAGPRTNLARQWAEAQPGHVFLLTVASPEGTRVVALEKP